MNSIGKRLREQRENLKLSQSKLGAIGGVGVSAQAQLEAGRSLPKADYLSKIAAAGVDIGYVVAGLYGASHAASATSPGASPSGNASYGERTAKIIRELSHSLLLTADALYRIALLTESKNSAPTSHDVRVRLDGFQKQVLKLATLATTNKPKTDHTGSTPVCVQESDLL